MCLLDFALASSLFEQSKQENTAASAALGKAAPWAGWNQRSKHGVLPQAQAGL